MKIRRILAGIDLGEETEKVLAFAFFFSSTHSASLHLLCVLDFLVTPPAYLGPYLDEERKLEEQKFHPWKQQLEGKGISAEVEFVTGRLHESFEASIKKHSPDMLVLGFRSHPFRKSSSEKLIKGFTVPILVVRGSKTTGVKIGGVSIRRILCPVDFSESSEKALIVARDLSASFSAELKVIHILPAHRIRERIPSGINRDRAMHELHEKAAASLETLKGTLGLPESAGVIVEGEPHAVISSAAADSDSDLIVMGARGSDLARGLIIGSVTDAVLKSSPCPVFVIH